MPEFLYLPFAVAGALAVTVPIILHLLRRTPGNRMPFTAVRFLEETPPKLTKRSRIEHWPLLLLRALAIILIGCAFARPFLRLVESAVRESGDGSRIAILIDRSASMRRAGVWDQAVEQAREIVDDSNDLDVISLHAFDQLSATLVDAEQWEQSDSSARRELVRSAIDELEPSWLPTETGQALFDLAEQLVRETDDAREERPREIVLITDFQHGSRLEALRGSTWPEDVTVRLVSVKAVQPGNAGVSFVPQADASATHVRARVVNAEDSPVLEFALRLQDRNGAVVGEAMPIMVAAGQRRTVSLPVPEGAVPAGIALEGDFHDFDNLAAVPEVQTPELSVAHVGSPDINDPEDMSYYLARVLDTDSRRKIRLVQLLEDSERVLPLPADVDAVVVTDVVPDELLSPLDRYAGGGGLVFVVLRSGEMAESVKSLLGGLVVSEASVRDYAMLADIDFTHPLFAAFSESRFADFSSIRFWRHRRLEVAAEQKADSWKSVARFDSGQPAIVEHRTDGGGRILVASSGWHPDDSQWALSTRFAPLIAGVLQLAVPVSTEQAAWTVGDVIHPEKMGIPDWTVEFPDARRLTAADDEAANGILLSQPGLYRVSGGDGAPIALSAGLTIRESMTEPLPNGTLIALNVKTNADSAASPEAPGSADTQKRQLRSQELESQQKYWRWFLLGGIVCLVAEQLLAKSLERRQATE